MRPLTFAERQQAIALAQLLQDLADAVRGHHVPGWLMANIAPSVVMIADSVQHFAAQQERLRRNAEHDCTREQCVR